MCVTTPNQDFIPEYPVERTMIKTYADGRWGVHEYSRWPQLLVDGMWHIACIPRRDWGLRNGLREVLWRSLKTSDWKEDPTAVVAELGFIEKTVVDDLAKAAETSIARYQAIEGVPSHRMEYGLQLIVVLRQCMDRLKLLASGPATAVAVAAHVQRLALELAGLTTYLTVVLPRLESHDDYKLSLLEVIGAFVKEGTAAATCVRLGLPVFFLQPLTRHIKVWQVVSVTRASFELSETDSSQPILHRPREFAGMMNLTGNWTAHMVVRISRDLCSSTLPEMSAPTASASGEASPEAKRPRAESSQMAGKQLAMPVRTRPESASPGALERPITSAGGAHPSREYMRSPFCSLPFVWVRALVEAGTLPQPPGSIVYFFPPPFLLDTKVHRYLHNLVRIRSFCRLRLFDPTRDGRPLSVADWRNALWGDYVVKDQPVVTTTIADKKRCKRRYEEKNAVSRLFGRDGSLRSYREDDAFLLGDIEVTRSVACSDRRVRSLLLWESHELNFRCELVALDRALLPRTGWPAFSQWQREARLSGVWGSNSGVLSVLPEVPGDHEKFQWRTSSSPDWRDYLSAMRALLAVMARWPDLPSVLQDLPVKEELWTEDHFEQAQSEATRFYTKTFVRHFHRLPTVPIPYPGQL
ncbi:uncharacterized protein TRAVEDRAFT_115234 [Trametes versicolor FP-101664 SS1]|uniref:uncharacterized protein n=1 Tax=Trametes versicolor (strain FP-101664) TaxID=717944 RepID=UPI00046213D1|nr:uncharacterized protein TRAVEDRAFT_115234 [Trametes versicolor FP-101664 SS1]EIW62390.1 hypothetical protein TRAVEDRAFT_115234 [Trametes versicolor FP-101664 SS1]